MDGWMYLKVSQSSNCCLLDHVKGICSHTVSFSVSWCLLKSWSSSVSSSDHYMKSLPPSLLTGAHGWSCEVSSTCSAVRWVSTNHQIKYLCLWWLKWKSMAISQSRLPVGGAFRCDSICSHRCRHRVQHVWVFLKHDKDLQIFFFAWSLMCVNRLNQSCGKN